MMAVTEPHIEFDSDLLAVPIEYADFVKEKYLLVLEQVN